MTPKLAAARVVVERRAPYVSALLWRLRLVEVEAWPADALGALGEVAVDEHGRVLLAAALVQRANAEQLAGALYHEASHLLRDHARRRGDREPLRFNVAGDAAINPDLAAAGFALPYAGVTPTGLGLEDGHAAEWYYERLPAPPPSNRRCCGSGAGARHAVEDEHPDADAAALDEAGLATARLEVALAVREAARRQRGTVPAELVRWAADLLAPVVPDWRRALAVALRGVLRGAGADDYAWGRPSPRYAASGLLVPSLRRRTVHAAVVIDTSGSVDEDGLGRAVLEVLGLARAAATVTVYAVDAEVHAVGDVRTEAQARALLRGGGGTDMGVGLAAAARPRRGARPDVVVVVTDGETPWPNRPPAGPRVVVVVPRAAPPTPPWARRVER